MSVINKSLIQLQTLQAWANDSQGRINKCETAIEAARLKVQKSKDSLQQLHSQIEAKATATKDLRMKLDQHDRTIARLEEARENVTQVGGGEEGDKRALLTQDIAHTFQKRNKDHGLVSDTLQARAIHWDAFHENVIAHDNNVKALDALSKDCRKSVATQRRFLTKQAGEAQRLTSMLQLASQEGLSSKSAPAKTNRGLSSRSMPNGENFDLVHRSDMGTSVLDDPATVADVHFLKQRS